ncbi:FAD-dependent monooxygenase [Aquincola sp. S2]|uniref:FAD-dependent monooxygenase n=1 Tax=Pseudaquabacterium terrae TaxID=2732868 RepID=A0ABX2ECC4_9BURK|nr:FAD-dependent monooxygenase [Aquabacterium terrae]NRF66228.1 FAD-dependent monooxygenase [Aquabacterium terrae]
MPPALNIAVIGAGPVGLALALHAARTLPASRISLFDARPLDKDVSADPRTLALSLGSVQLLQRLQAWPAADAEPILEVHVSQAPPTLAADSAVRIRAIDEAVRMLGAVLSYGRLVAPLQQAWLELAAQHPERLSTRFGQPVTALKPLASGVEIDAGVAERFDLAVIAEGGVFAESPGRALAPRQREPLRHDYRQTAWVGTLELAGGTRGLAVERFTRHGPLAVLPLRPLAPVSAAHPASGPLRAALVWCVPSDDDPVRELDDAQRLVVLESQLPEAAGRPVAISALKAFPLGLNAERTLVDGATVRIGNAAQTLHPVAGQGLNLGLRDAFELVLALRDAPSVGAALRRVEWSRAPDRWAMIAATDFLARSFTWRWPGLPAARGLSLAALQALPPLKSLLARRMMFGRR